MKNSCIFALSLLVAITRNLESASDPSPSATKPSNTPIQTITPTPRSDSGVSLPKAGLVPDKDTAIKIAEAILFRLYGQEAIVAQRPYIVKEEDYIWWISGTIKEEALGFHFTIAISKHTGAVLHLTLD